MKAKFTSVIGLTLAILLILLILIFGITIIQNPYLNYNSMLNENIMKLNETEEFVFNDIIPFEWDAAYTFEPGTTKEEIEEILGFKNAKIKNIPKNGTNHIIFVDENQITAYPNILNEKLFYEFKFEKENENDKYAVIHNYEYPVFYAESENGIFKLTDMMVVMKELKEKNT